MGNFVRFKAEGKGREEGGWGKIKEKLRDEGAALVTAGPIKTKESRGETGGLWRKIKEVEKEDITAARKSKHTLPKIMLSQKQ